MDAGTIDYDIRTSDVTTASHNATTSLDDADVERISTTIKDRLMRAFYLSISCLGVSGNLLVLLVLLSLSKMRRRLTSVFIINQSLVDTLTAVFLLLTTLLPNDGRLFASLADDLYCRLWVTRLPLWLCIHCSTYNLVALTLERYFSVVHPIRHKMSFDRSKALMMVIGCWLFATVYSLAATIPTVRIEGGSCRMFLFKSKVDMQAKGIVGVSLVYFIPLFILVYCYSMMAYALRTKVAPLTTGGTTTGSRDDREATNKPNLSMKARAKRNVIKTLAVVSTAFVFCTSWNQWFFFLFNLGVYDYDALNTTFYHFSVIAMFANCCVNPFIYAVQYEEFQNGLKKIVLRRKTPQIDMSST